MLNDGNYYECEGLKEKMGVIHGKTPFSRMWAIGVIGTKKM